MTVVSARFFLLAVTLAGVGCTETLPPHPPQEAISRGEPLSTIDDSAKAGDAGVVSGRLAVIETFAPAGPVGFETVTLYRAGAPVSHATSDARGAFMFVGIKGGSDYELRVASDRFVGSRPFSLPAGGHASVDLIVHAAAARQK
jgi:hypothetical protein